MHCFQLELFNTIGNLVNSYEIIKEYHLSDFKNLDHYCFKRIYLDGGVLDIERKKGRQINIKFFTKSYVLPRIG